MLADPTTLRLTRHNQYMQQPHRNPVKYRDTILTTLDRMLQHAQHLTDTLYYEVSC
jgi:ubiquitin carboxyl-terminal hydrolase 7